MVRVADQSETTTPWNPHSLLEKTPEQRRIRGHRVAVHRVVCGHDHGHVGFENACLERSEIQLAQHRLADPRVIGASIGFEVVGDEVFDGCADTGLLHTAHVRHGDTRGEQGSSEKRSKPRRESGVRMMFMVGASRTSTPRERACSPSASAISMDHVPHPTWRRARPDMGAMTRGCLGRSDAHARQRDRRTPPSSEARSVVDGIERPRVLTGQQAHLLLEGEPCHQAELVVPCDGWRWRSWTAFPLLSSGSGCRPARAGRTDPAISRDDVESWRVLRSSGNRLELHEDVGHLRIARRRIHVRLRLIGPPTYLALLYTFQSAP